MSDSLLENAQRKIAEGNLAGALQDLNSALQSNPGTATVVFQRGMLHLRMHHYRQALADFDSAITSGAVLADVLGQRSLVKIQLRDYVGAIADSEQAARLDPGYFQNYLYQGLAHFNLGHYADSIPCFSEALQRNPAHAESRRLRGMAYCLCGQFSEGGNDIETVLKENAQDDQAWFWMGYLRQQKDDLDGAVEALSRSIALNAYNKAAFIGRGRAYLGLGDNKKALADFLSAHTLDPNWEVLPDLIREARRNEERRGRVFNIVRS
jgi:tetratricopeptide (TPR) repeat protein